MVSSKRKAWIEAMRLRTLPVSVAGVLAGCACALLCGSFRILPAICCLLFALLAQVASNFANEYYDFKNGLDRKGREGFRRGVTEGDISPGAMKRAVFLTLAAAAIPGCALIIWGGLWLLAVGIIICLFALAYSTGPYPLSHHGLGDVAVIIFFGLVPVGFSTWLISGVSMCGLPIAMSLLTGLGVGMLAANVLIVNNYRDADDDAAVGKKTTVVLFGRRFMGRIYLFNSIVGLLLLCSPSIFLIPARGYWLVIPCILIPLAIKNHSRLIHCHPAGGSNAKSAGEKGWAQLNPLLKKTAILLLMACMILLAESVIFSLFQR